MKFRKEIKKRREKKRKEKKRKEKKRKRKEREKKERKEKTFNGFLTVSSLFPAVLITREVKVCLNISRSIPKIFMDLFIIYLLL